MCRLCCAVLPGRNYQRGVGWLCLLPCLTGSPCLASCSHVEVFRTVIPSCISWCCSSTLPPMFIPALLLAPLQTDCPTLVDLDLYDSSNHNHYFNLKRGTRFETGKTHLRCCALACAGAVFFCCDFSFLLFV